MQKAEWATHRVTALFSGGDARKFGRIVVA